MHDAPHLKRRASLLCSLGISLLSQLCSAAAPVESGTSQGSAQPSEFVSQYQQGESFYEAKKYEQAIQCFQRALAIKPDPNVLYNIAQSHRKLQRYREAKTHFEWFLRIPNGISADERQRVELIVADLGEKIRQEEARKLVIVKEETPKRPPWRIGVGITGIAAGVVLLTFGGLAASVDSQPYLDANKDDFTRIYATSGLAAGLIAPGGLLVVGGTILLALPGAKPPTPAAKQATLAPSFLGWIGLGSAMAPTGVP